MVREHIEDLGTGQGVEPLNEGIVENEGGGGELIGDPVLAKELVAKVGNVEHMWVEHAILVH